MNGISIGLLAILPSLAVACFAYFFIDRKKKEALFPTAITFLLGVLIAFPAYFAQEAAWEKITWFSTDSGLSFFVYAFFVVALVEEALKFLINFFYPYKGSHAEEKTDLILYAILIGMGFAMLENFLYGLQYGFEVILLRALTAVPAHAVFGGIMGYYLAQAKFGDNKKKPLLLAFLIPFVLHGLYDFFLMQEWSEYLMLSSIIILILSAIFLGKKIIALHKEAS